MIFLQATTKIDLLEMVKSMLLDFAAFVPNLVGALLIIFVGWFIARLLARLLKKLLQKTGVDNLAEKFNDIDIIHRSKVRIVPSYLFSKLLYYLLLFVVIAAAVDVLNMEAVSDLMNDLLNYFPFLLSAFFVFIIGILVSDFLRNLVQTTCISLGIPAASLISSFVFYFLFINIVMITLDQAKIDTDFIQDNLSIILSGIVLAFAIGYGFAARPMVANLLSAYYNRDRVKIGDVIGIDGVKGQIVAKDSSTITIQTNDRKIIVPLSKLSSEKYEIFED